MGGKSAAKSAQRDAEKARADEEARQARIKEGTASINQMFDTGGFNNAYYDDIAKSYLDYANPQLADQHKSANQQLVFDLARGGKLDSSTRATQGAKLQESYDLGQQQIADKALSVKNDTKNSVEDARASLISQLNATGDATGATNAAINRMAALSKPAGNYDTLANMFADFTSSLSSKYAQEKAYAASGGASSTGYTPVTYGASTGAVKVTG